MTAEEYLMQESLKKKAKKKKVKRAFLIFINAILLCYLVFCIYDTCIEFYNKSFHEDEKILSVGGYSTKKSLEIYDKYIDKDGDIYQTINVQDFSFYSGYLNFKEYTDTKDENNNLIISSFNTYYLQNISLNKYEKGITFENDYQVNNFINKGIYLFDDSLNEGDYIIYPYNYEYEKSEKIPLKINSEKGIYKTYYSPLINGKRKRIELKSKTSSPCLLISIKNVYTVSTNDISFLYQKDEEKDTLNELFKNNFTKKFIASSPTLEENIKSLYLSHSLINVVVSNTYNAPITITHYFDVNYDETLYKNADLDDVLLIYDEDNYIRELGGHLFNAGSGVKYKNDSTKYLNSYKGEFDEGSLTLIVRSDSLNEIIPFLNNIFNFNLK